MKTKKRPKKPTIGDLFSWYEPSFYASLEEEGERGFLRYRVLALILGRLRSIEEWFPDEKRLARQKKEEAIRDLRAYDCLPPELRKGQADATFARLLEDPEALGAAIERRGFMIKMNHLARDAADQREALLI